MLTESCTWQAPHLSQLQDQASTLNLSTCKSSCKCCYFHERTNASVCGCIYLAVNYMHICTPECYILLTSLTHTCHSCVRDFFSLLLCNKGACSLCMTILHSDKCEEIHSFLATYCWLWGNEETQGSESVTQTSRQRQWFTVLLLLCLGSNKPVLQRGALFKFSLLPNKDGPHSLITRLWRQNKSCAHAERYAHF